MQKSSSPGTQDAAFFWCWDETYWELTTKVHSGCVIQCRFYYTRLVKMHPLICILNPLINPLIHVRKHMHFLTSAIIPYSPIHPTKPERNIPRNLILHWTILRVTFKNLTATTTTTKKSHTYRTKSYTSITAHWAADSVQKSHKFKSSPAFLEKQGNHRHISLLRSRLIPTQLRHYSAIQLDNKDTLLPLGRWWAK